MHLKSKHGGPRVAPLVEPFGPDEAAVMKAFGMPIMLFRILTRRLDRARGVLGWGGYYLSRQTALTLRHRELIIDRTTALCGAHYEWAIHVAVYAGKARITDTELHSLATGTWTDDCWHDLGDRSVIRAVDALHRHSDLDDEEWEALVTHIGEAAAIDLLLVAGWYHAIAYSVNALRLPLEPGTTGIPTSR